MKKNIVAAFCFLLSINSVSAMNDMPFCGSIKRCKDFIVSDIDKNSRLGQITVERVRKWKTCFGIIMNSGDENTDETFLRIRQTGLSIEEADKILDELVELSHLITEHCCLIGKKHPIDSGDVTKCMELIAFLTE